MAKLSALLAPGSYEQLDALLKSARDTRETKERAAELAELIATQDKDLPPEGAMAKTAALQIMAHGKPLHHTWLSGRLHKSVEPEQIFEDYRAGDTSERWQTYLERAEIDPPKKHER